MSAPAFTNVAEDNATVGIQASVVHFDIDYVMGPDARPEDYFEMGVRYLGAGMPAEAGRLLEEAAARGHDTAELQFYRLLALLTGRALHQMETADFDRLDAIFADMRPLGEDEWSAGLRAILLLVDAVRQADLDLALKEIESLPDPQRGLVLKHLGVLREGPVEDHMWRLSVRQAQAGQTAGGRKDRLWAFFQPEPAGARALHPRPASDTPIDRIRLIGGGAMFVLAVMELGSVTLRGSEPAPQLAFCIAIAGFLVFLVNGADWYFRVRWVRAKDAEFRLVRRRERAPVGGFTNRVGRIVTRYFRQYVPHGTDRETWLSLTAGLRRRIRDELVEIYREEPIKANQIAWLVRHMVSDVRQRWEKNTLLAYRVRWRTPWPVKAACGIGLLTVAVAAYWFVPAAIRVEPLAGSLAVVATLLSAAIAVGSGFRIAAERRRVRIEYEEYAVKLGARREAYARWVEKLSCKPSDAEMAEWLECDRRILVDDTMRHYRLHPHQVIAHAFIEAPGRYAKRARIPHGPWRYSRYRMLLFLLTTEGVRQVNIDLDFKKVEFRRTQRLNYRFDTVAAVGIRGAQRQRQTFELTLFNGDPVRVPVSEPPEDEYPGDEDDETFRLDLDASGLARTLNVMEGIAAEGKDWIRRRQHRAGERLGALSETIRSLIDP